MFSDCQKKKVINQFCGHFEFWEPVVDVVIVSVRSSLGVVLYITLFFFDTYICWWFFFIQIYMLRYTYIYRKIVNIKIVYTWICVYVKKKIMYNIENHSEKKKLQNEHTYTFLYEIFWLVHLYEIPFHHKRENQLIYAYWCL